MSDVAIDIPIVVSRTRPQRKLSTTLLLLLLALFLGTFMTLVYLWQAVSTHPSMLNVLSDGIDAEAAAFEFAMRHHRRTAEVRLPPATQHGVAPPAAVVSPEKSLQELRQAASDPTKSSREGSSKLTVDPRRDEIKEAFLHAWNGYVECAWGFDELQPVSCHGKNSFGVGLTILDSLSTLHIMGLKDEFQKARDWVAEKLTFQRPFAVSVFETTIRVLGGLLSAYDLSRDAIFLEKAREIGDILIEAFADNGLPYPFVHLTSKAKSAPGWHSGHLILSELGTLQMEFVTLSYHLNDPKYAEKAMDLLKKLIEYKTTVVPDGLLPNMWRLAAPLQHAGNKVAMGALGDSYYEYLLKLWLLTGKQHNSLRDAYSAAANSIVNVMMQSTTDGSIRFVSELNGHRPTRRMDHLACFSGGMLELGSVSGAHTAADGNVVNGKLAVSTHEAAKDIAHACLEMYRQQASKLAPESVDYRGNSFSSAGNSRYYLSRPETVETLMYLYRLDGGNEKYREMGYEIFSAIQKHTKTAHGYSGVKDVTKVPVVLDDLMQTFLLAETFKYLYLLYSPEDVMPLDQYVFNTEAHPLSVLRDTDNVVFRQVLNKF